ncbi:hypothetical protein [Novosphingobium sp. RL4]|uniref:hypothetical protein n=1 Tax=Novosphingobium sp. RL4 TaxID=3109595 RepID=UPI002D782DBC|nr:hypothetical protein [Novosphingobium sp. RL4]WRT91352.1 hypothetical protein U9J33_08920 [Novosphingobium sp. RL4]
MSGPEMEIRRLNSPGPISDQFLLSRAFLKIIIGPVGSAKTITALRALRRVGTRQGGRRDANGVLRRKARVGVIRETYPNIEKNTLPSWFRIHPETDGKFTWKAPFTHKLTLILGHDEFGRPNDVCDFEIEFRAIGDRSVEEACRGWEVVAVMIDEADLQPPDLLAFLSGRVGRASDLDPSLVVDQQIILSLNAPYMDNWIYGLAIEKNLGELLDPGLMEALGDRPLMEVFLQPGGREPDAENLHNLPKGYYAIQAALNKHRPDYVARMIDNKFVPMQHGQPVNPQFDYRAHVRPLDLNPRLPLLVGFDQGLFAAAVASQRLSMGEFRTLAEAVMFREDGRTLAKIGPTAAGAMVRSMIAARFPNLDPGMLRVVGDPAAWSARDRQDSEHDWVLAFQKGLGHRVYKGKTNRQALRNEAIWRAMAERDGYAVDPSAKHLIRGHLGGYRYRNADIPGGGGTRGHLEIADTIHTHVCDAEQYAAVEGEHVISDIRGRPRSGGQVFVNDSDFDVFSRSY